MSRTDLIKGLPGLSEDRRERALELQTRIQTLQTELEELIGRSSAETNLIELQDRGINKIQATDLRARLAAFAEDWDRPEAAIYDEEPAR